MNNRNPKVDNQSEDELAGYGDEDGQTDLGQIVGESGGSLRTLQRRFLVETGMALSEWRQQARLIAGAESLLDGSSVTEAALAAGYSGVSALSMRFGANLATPLRSSGRWRLPAADSNSVIPSASGGG